MFGLLFALTLGCIKPFPDAPKEVEETGYSDSPDLPCAYWVGDKVCDFVRTETSTGLPISLYDFSGSPIVLDLSAMWCGPCQAAAADTNNTVARYSDNNLRYITVLFEDLQGNHPDGEDLQLWVDNFGITEPVLASDYSLLNADSSQGFPLRAWPTFILIDENLIIRERVEGYSQETLDEAIDRLIQN